MSGQLGQQGTTGGAEGVAGLGNRMVAESIPRLGSHREAAVAELARKGSNRAVDGVVRRRRVDLAGVIKTRFNVTLADRGAGARRRSRSCGEPVERVASR